jgi:transglutaminase-like putative cysteine protease
MNIPARYCTGYLGDIGVPLSDAPMDFSAWFEAYLGGRWYTFDARHNKPRMGRILMARGRDATDVGIVTSFGPCTLASFKDPLDPLGRTSDPLQLARRVTPPTTSVFRQAWSVRSRRREQRTMRR